MSIECRCDKCRKYFDSNEIYCSDCVSELESYLETAYREIEVLKSQIKEQ